MKNKIVKIAPWILAAVLGFVFGTVYQTISNQGSLNAMEKSIIEATKLAERIQQTVSSLNFNSPSFGSFAGDYQAKTVSSANASGTLSMVIRGGNGLLGSIIVSSSSGSTLRVYDGSATSTGTLIGTIKAGVTEQAFLYDVGVATGIVLDVPPTFNGAYTITYR
jgi:hypothetical protein